jgi:drug/metabolite transporter (DMT)-like permease
MTTVETGREKKKGNENKVITGILIAVLSIIWGSSFILMKKGLKVFTPGEVAAYRMFVSFLVTIPFSLKHIKTVKPHQWRFMAASGLLGNGIPSFLFTTAQTMISSSMAGMLNSLTPVFTLIAGSLVFKIKARKENIAGVFLGLAGAVTLIMIHSTGAIGSNPNYGLLIVMATIGYAFSVNILRSKLYELEPVVITGFALMFVGIPCGIYLFFTPFYQIIFSNAEAGKAFAYISILGIMGTGVSTVLFNRLIKLTTALTASSVTYLIPIVAMLWGLLDSESFGPFHILSMAGILGGVYLINKKPQ